MPVFWSDTESVLYVHVPKTGGSSVEAHFLGAKYDFSFLITKHSPIFTPMRCSPQHYHAAMIDVIFDTSKFDLVLMTVRHPVSRIISEYKMRCPEGRHPEKWIEEGFEKYIENSYIFDNHLRPQREFFVEGAKVFKLEDGFCDEWVKSVNRHLDRKLEVRSFHKLKSEKSEIHLGIGTIRMIEEFYKEDFDFFNY